MSKNSFLKKILRRFISGKRTLQPESAVSLEPASLEKLLSMVENTDEVEISCDDVFELLDVYVELEARGEDVSSLMPLVKRHLDKCRSCREEYEALVQVFEATLDDRL